MLRPFLLHNLLRRSPFSRAILGVSTEGFETENRGPGLGDPSRLLLRLIIVKDSVGRPGPARVGRSSTKAKRS